MLFAGIDESRPWPNTGMTTDKWKQIVPTKVPISDLIATQDGIYLAPLGKSMYDLVNSSHSGDMFPHVVSWKGKLYLEDGHHRAVRMLLDGEFSIRARVLTIIDHGE